jgi:hypothetical protein
MPDLKLRGHHTTISYLVVVDREGFPLIRIEFWKMSPGGLIASAPPTQEVEQLKPGCCSSLPVLELCGLDSHLNRRPGASFRSNAYTKPNDTKVWLWAEPLL